ncbi:hypothetical protein HKD37_06G016199 [Glycine soja]
MSNLAPKRKVLKLELDEDLLVHLIVISLPTHFDQFKVSYNTKKDKWFINVQEEDRYESVHLSLIDEEKVSKVC